MADEKSCQYTYWKRDRETGESIEVPCPHDYFVTWRDGETGGARDYCIFHTPLEAKKERLGLFWSKFWREFATAKKAVETSSEEEKEHVTFDCHGFVFPDTGPRFRSRCFPFDVDFGEAEFKGDADFRRAEFNGKAGFKKAKFSGDVYFRWAEFSGDAYFTSAEFLGLARFWEAKFSRVALFLRAEFEGDATFWAAEFSGDADFEDAGFSGKADFIRAEFKGRADFGRAKFTGNADFRGAEFSGDAEFWRAEFSGDANFRYAKFSGDAYFAGAEFSGAAYFIDTEFSRRPKFGSAKFSRYATFLRAKLTQAEFYGVDIRGLDFTEAKIGEYAQRIRGGSKEKGADGRCALAGEARLEPVGSADFSGANYNAHNCYLALNLYRAFFGVAWSVTRLYKFIKKDVKLPKYRPRRFYRTKFYYVDTSAVDWSKNPALGRDIRYQQFLYQFWTRRPLCLYRSLYSLWWATSRCGESFKRWVAWSVLLVVLFAGLYTYLPAYAGAPLITERQVATAECPGCGAVIDMSNEAPATPSFKTSLYFSVVTFWTLGSGDVTQTGDLGKLVVAVEVILGYLMLGGLIALFANKLVRRE